MVTLLKGRFLKRISQRAGTDESSPNEFELAREEGTMLTLF